MTIAPARHRENARTVRRADRETHHPELRRCGTAKLDGPQIDIFYATLSKSGRRDGNGGLSPQTVGHIHRLLSLILASAVKAKKLTASPMAGVRTTLTCAPDIQVLDDAEMAMLF